MTYCMMRNSTLFGELLSLKIHFYSPRKWSMVSKMYTSSFNEFFGDDVLTLYTRLVSSGLIKKTNRIMKYVSFSRSSIWWKAFCGELTKKDVVTLSEMNSKTQNHSHKKVTSITKETGTTEYLVSGDDSTFSRERQNLLTGFVLPVKGLVCFCPPDYKNPVKNGDIEILAESLTSLDSINDKLLSGKKVINRKGDGGGDRDGDGVDDRHGSPDKHKKSVKGDFGAPNPNRNKYCLRSHTCGDLDESHVGQEVRLMGWIQFSRLDKFVLLRDAYGKIQLVIPDSRNDLKNLLTGLTVESVISVGGLVCLRPSGNQNPKLKGGAIEVIVTDLVVLNKSKLLPFNIRDFNKPRESLRLKYRYLDLRYENMQNNLRSRSNILHKMRKFLVEQLDFVEVETPTLFKRTPGGAQEFIVPTQNEGKFYSLVQSPQQFKQLLMVGSIDRYFQVARCYRDESCSSDRQPEFTQLDMEMSFCERKDILNLTEDLLKYCWPNDLGELVTPFPRLSFHDAIDFYGTDKPDLRFDWKLQDLTEIFIEEKDSKKENYNFNNYFYKGDFAVYGFVGRSETVQFFENEVKNLQDEMNSNFPNISFLFFHIASKGMITEKIESLFGNSVASQVEKVMEYDAGDALFLAIGSKKSVRECLGKVRIDFANYLEEKKNDAARKGGFKFVWILDFPLFELKDNQMHSCHHPFTQPHPEDLHLLQTHPLQVRGLNFDLVLNGREVGGGSMRITDFQLQKKIFDEFLKIESGSISHLLEALDSGAPPHGGIALGLDRLFAIICGTRSIRDVMAFPKNHYGVDGMSGAPSAITNHERKLYHIPLKED